jgi:1-acyl-sn-glycerol-3-phosphate acyltransferase
MPFHANLLQSAIDAQAPVQPLALQFVDAQTNEISMAARFVGDDTLVSSVWSRTLNARRLKAVVNFGEIEMAQGQDRRAWAQTLRGKVMGLKEKCRP